MNPRFKRNNFDLLRFLFAFTVFLVHTHVLSGRPELEVFAELLSSDLAVKSFFVVSGLLVFMSYENSGSLKVYFEKRIRRIYPAYFTVVAGCALLFVFASSGGPGAYFNTDWVRYLAANLSFANFLHPTLPGVFGANRFAEINGALWTLKVEVMFYAIVPVVAWFCLRLGRLRALAAFAAASLAYAAWMEALARSTGSEFYVLLARQLPGQLSYFLAGAFFYYYLEIFERHLAWFATAAIACFVLHRCYGFSAFEPLWLATFVAFFGFFAYAGNFGRFGDFSYGIYILHFPIVQTLVSLGVFARSPWLGVAVSAALVLAAAVLMWKLVEKPFLRRTSHYVLATRTAPPS
ncbi:MAG TPA: acyltransferase [Burkholderiales bacterium]